MLFDVITEQLVASEWEYRSKFWFWSLDWNKQGGTLYGHVHVLHPIEQGTDHRKNWDDIWYESTELM